MNKKKEKNNQKSKILAEKILYYKKHLDAVPTELISVQITEEDRSEIDSNYEQLNSPSDQLMDSKFYSLLVKMNRERDKYFLREGTTRRERIHILSKLMLRVTTPILELNHRRVFDLNENTFFGIKSFGERKESIDEKVVYTDPENDLEIPQISYEDINKMKKNLYSKFVNTELKNIEDLNKELTSLEADIFSQMARDNELIVTIDLKSGKVSIHKNVNNLKNLKTYLILIEPKNET